MKPSKRRGNSGVTLVELMIAVAIITIGILGFVGAFQFITKALHISRSRTLATNLAQEKIESLKNLSYYELLITTASNQDNNFSPAILYDTSNYPPDQVAIGGINFTRYTYVALAQFVADTVSTVTYTYPDTGMKQLITTVVWRDAGNWKKWTLTNLLENPNVAPLDSNITGHVNGAAPFARPLASALVILEGYPDQQTHADVNGSYSFHVFHGSYTVRASSTGYVDGESAPVSAVEGTNVVASPDPIQLTQITTGIVAGTAWLTKNVVISQVVVSTVMAESGFKVQYVELYNPTTTTVTVDVSGTPNIQLHFDSASPTQGAYSCDDIPMTYVKDTIPPYGYYVFANTGTFIVNGVSINADAVWTDAANSSCDAGQPAATVWDTSVSPKLKRFTQSGFAGSFYIGDASDNTIDTVGWSNITLGDAPTFFEGSYIDLTSGFPVGEQLVRISSPSANLNVSDMMTYGRAYDSDSNANDFFYPRGATTFGLVYSPRNSTYAAKPPVAGIPAVGAYVATSDPYSASVTASAATISSGPFSLLYAPFRLAGVTTTNAAAACAGQCWVLDVASSTYYAQYSTVTVSQNIVTGVPNADTGPAWDFSGKYHLHMASQATSGYVKGNVSDINGIAINGVTTGISVSVAGISHILGTNGDYFGSASTGVVTVIANTNFTAPYVQVVALPTVVEGQVTTQDFILSQGGSIVGTGVNSSGNAIPNYTFVATQGGAEAGSGVSNLSGAFSIRNLSTGTYTVTPTIDSGKSSSPTSVTVNVSTPGAYSAGTFTIFGAMGTLSGTVKLNNALVTTGALILASSTTWPASVNTSGPPAIVGSSAPALSPMYAISSLADGTYSLSVRGGFSYYMLIYIPTVDATGRVSVSTGTPATQAGVGAGKTATYNISQ
ncbi:MAG: prepilin-type N-terminal cleavage/methylation domain-containing protein [Elusimicrobia bacterium]|nr:prepilin-type N-terminal cleavage/methylation domain-containing protein [Elusimicrobiota bacterium]